MFLCEQEAVQTASSARPASRRARSRRTQAERRAATRSRILDAVVETIAEVGFRRTTASAIAARAGVTWGAVQHHYGDKDGIFAAVLDDTFARFATHFADLANPTALPLRIRTREFAERSWRHFGSAHFRSTFEILLQALGRTPPKRGELASPQQMRMLEGFDALWQRVFPDVALPRGERISLERFAIATLTGLALQCSLTRGHAPEPHAELALLAETLAHRLEGAARAGRTVRRGRR